MLAKLLKGIEQKNFGSSDTIASIIPKADAISQTYFFLPQIRYFPSPRISADEQLSTLFKLPVSQMRRLPVYNVYFSY